MYPNVDHRDQINSTLNCHHDCIVQTEHNINTKPNACLLIWDECWQLVAMTRGITYWIWQRTNPVEYLRLWNKQTTMALVNRLFKFLLVFGLPVLAILSIFYSSAHRNNKLLLDRFENTKWTSSSHSNKSLIFVKYCPSVSPQLSNNI